jgi:hypothetical protein
VLEHAVAPSTDVENDRVAFGGAATEGDQLALTSRIRGNRQVLERSAHRADRRRGVGVDADNDIKKLDGEPASSSLLS